jgi:hypothetical protein
LLLNAAGSASYLWDAAHLHLASPVKKQIPAPARLSYTIPSEDFFPMSDGREEREEQEKRRQQEQQENREDRLHRDPIDPWQPERPDS